MINVRGRTDRGTVTDSIASAVKGPLDSAAALVAAAGEVEEAVVAVVGEASLAVEASPEVETVPFRRAAATPTVVATALRSARTPCRPIRLV